MYYPMTPTSIMAYQQDRLRGSERKYLVRAVKSPLHARILVRVGRFLASTGRSLRERYEPAFVASPEISATAAGKTDYC